MAGAYGRFFFHCYSDAHKRLRSALRFFTLSTPILSLFGIIEQDNDAPSEKIAFGCLISYFLVLTGFTRSI